MDEFELIRRFFLRDNNDKSVLIGIGDDGAVIKPSPEHDLVMSTDTLIEDIHFPNCLSAEDIGYRCVAVNVSDIAAMGARARWMTLALTLPNIDQEWLKKFSNGFYSAAQEYGVSLIGGDTTQGQKISLTVNITGEVKPKQAITRSNASYDDLIFVTGNIGDAAAGLDLIVNSSDINDMKKSLIRRFSRPTARHELGQALSGIASAAIDISDGLYADTKKLLMASELGGHLYIDRLPISKALKETFGQERSIECSLGGGDDYELLFTAPAIKLNEIHEIVNKYNIPITEIGEVRKYSQLSCSLNDKLFNYDDSGYLHFNG
jgi:thiamine-monophosphate kinase